MKTIKYINTFVVSLPLLLIIFGYLINDSAGNYFGYGLFSILLTGFAQILIGLYRLFTTPNRIYYIIYFALVILFFSVWYLNVKLNYINTITFILLPIPAILAIYMSILIYKEK